MLDLVELFTHWHAGRSQVQLSDSLGIDRKTVRKYLAPAIADGMEPGGEPLSAGQWAELIDGWFPEQNDPAARASTWPLITPHHDRIRPGWTLMSRWPRSLNGCATTTGWRRRSRRCGVGSQHISPRKWLGRK